MPLTSSLIADWAALDLKNALVFKSDMNAGAIYFISADKYKAEYIFFVLSKTGTGKYEKTEKRTGSVSMRTHETQIIRNGGISLYWQPPTNLYITNGIQEASIISISEVALFNEGNFNKIEWSSVKKANR